jgi:hypothetical protein
MWRRGQWWKKVVNQGVLLQVTIRRWTVWIAGNGSAFLVGIQRQFQGEQAERGARDQFLLLVPEQRPMTSVKSQQIESGV